MSAFSATYSPEDNKLRLYASARLSPELYARVKACGFSWAPKQEVFVAPAWSPNREDLALELAGEIGDEDTTLVDRAEQRAERFDDYSDKRAADAESARKAVAAIADNIPFGQPILVGHHSEKHARRDAAKIENGMRRAVRMWDTAKYWQDRAAGALAHAKYKERPDVRARRIKKLEAEARKVAKQIADVARFVKLWGMVADGGGRRKSGEPATAMDRALFVANYDHVSRCFQLADFPRDPPASQYEGQMSLWSALDGGVITAEQATEIALRVHSVGAEHRDRWAAHLANRLAYERAMLAESGGTAADKTGPEQGGACRCWASPGRYSGGWSYIQKVNKVSVTVLDNWGNGGRDFTRTIPFDKLQGIMTAADVQAARDAGRLREIDARGFFLSDAPPPERAPREETPADAAVFEAMRKSAAQGVQVVAVPQLFPTPREVAARMVELADIRPGDRVLEPSAGTGAIIGAMGGRMFGHNPERGGLVAVEHVGALADRLRVEFPLTDVRCADFLACNGDLGAFDRVLMNPPFINGADIKHIEHAAGMLKPGGRLVAICADGPRQRAALQPIADHWESLPAGTFKDAGTMVNAALLVMVRS